MTDRPTVLFVCVHNAGRSQMAAGLLKLRSAGRINVRSAGSSPEEEINPNAVVTVGGGSSIGVDPEGRVLFEAGSGEEFIPEVLDLDRVQTVRERGTRGLNRLLHHVRDAPRAAFSAYDGLGRD